MRHVECVCRLTERVKTPHPAQSIRFIFSHAVVSPWVCGTSTLMMIKTAASAMAGTCIQNAARQPRTSATAPPTTAPVAAPAPKRTLMPPWYRPRSAIETRSVMMIAYKVSDAWAGPITASIIGDYEATRHTVTVSMPPEPIPATPRAMRMVSMLGATAHASVPTVK